MLVRPLLLRSSIGIMLLVLLYYAVVDYLHTIAGYLSTATNQAVEKLQVSLSVPPLSE